MPTDAMPRAQRDRVRLRCGRHPIALVAAAATIVVALLLAVPASATGRAEPPIVVDPGQCEVEPRSATDLAALANATPRPTATPAPPDPAGMPVATPAFAPPDVVAAVTATIAEVAACTNSGEFDRSLALFSDDLFLAFFGGLSAEDLGTMLTPTAAAPLEDPIAEVVVEDVRLLPDGRVLAISRYDGVPSRTVLVRVGSRYLIDAIDDLPAATPVPRG